MIEALGGGGRGAHRWRGCMRRSRKRRSSAVQAYDGGCSGVRSGGRHGVDRSGWRRQGREGGRHGVERAGDGGSGGTRRAGQAVRSQSVGWAGRARTRG
jgi:hypothetical protein